MVLRVCNTKVRAMFNVICLSSATLEWHVTNCETRVHVCKRRQCILPAPPLSGTSKIVVCANAGSEFFQRHPCLPSFLLSELAVAVEVLERDSVASATPGVCSIYSHVCVSNYICMHVYDRVFERDSAVTATPGVCSMFFFACVY